jgi:(4-O-methyl)-D-glucuronate---lignin esterase
MKRNFRSLHPLFFVIVIITLVVVGVRAAAQKDFTSFPPADVTREMDRDQMLVQLGITLPKLPPKLDDPNAPPGAYPRDSLDPEGSWRDSYGHTIVRSPWGLWNNYDDESNGYFPGPDSSHLGAYTPFHLLRMNNGKQIATAGQWWTLKRPEILTAMRQELYGFVPRDSVLPSVKFSVKTSTGGRGNLAYIQKEINGTIDTSRYPKVRDVPAISCILRIPAGATDPVPVMIVFAGFGNALDRYWGITAPNGWSVCTFDPNALQPDNGIGLTSYLIGLVNKGHWRKPNDWGSIVAWSWGIGRLIDYFETDKDVDATKIGLTGHSRYGKATLVTMALEQRLAIGFPSDGGSLGTAPTRRHWGQDLENSTGANEYHWMAGNFFKWAGELAPGQYLPRKIEKLSVDSNSLLALCAPRPMLLNGGTQSSWTDPYGQYLTTLYATPVYKLLGKKGIVMRDEKPQIDKAYIEGDLAYRYHDGGHTDAPEWPTFFAFAAKYIKVPVLEVSSSFVMLGKDAGSRDTANIKSNQDWKISGTANWFSASKHLGNIIVDAKATRSKFARSAVLAVVTKGIDRKVLVIQAAGRPALAISNKNLTIESGGDHPVSFDVASNAAWAVSCSDDWVYSSVEAGSNDRTVIIQASSNPGVKERNVAITISKPKI